MNERRLRVVHVAPGLDTGGLERLLVEFARHTDRARFDLRFVSLGTRGRLADEVESCGWPVTALGKPPGRRPGLVFRLARRFRRWGADVVQTHNDAPLLYGIPAARLARVPQIIHTRHGQDLHYSRLESSSFRLAARLASRVVCVSRDNAQMAIESGLDPRRLVTIWNGIDLDRYAYGGPVENGPVVAVARLKRDKDLATLLRAVAIASVEHPPIRLEVAGDGPCRGRLESLADELGLGDRVRFLGDVEDVPRLLGRAALFVLPSRNEGISLTLLEAMARGLPVVTTRVGGNPEVVLDGETGLLVPAADPSALAAAVVRLLRDAEEAIRMGRAGRARAGEHFDVRRMVRDYEALYVEEGGPSRRGARAGCLSRS